VCSSDLAIAKEQDYYFDMKKEYEGLFK
jgi:hypothetical protein